MRAFSAVILALSLAACSESSFQGASDKNVKAPAKPAKNDRNDKSSADAKNPGKAGQKPSTRPGAKKSDPSNELSPDADGPSADNPAATNPSGAPVVPDNDPNDPNANNPGDPGATTPAAPTEPPATQPATTQPSPNITADDLVADVEAAATGLVFDGAQLVCLNWKTGVLRSQNMYKKFFAINFVFTVKSSRGPAQPVVLGSDTQVQLPGKWGDAVCGASPHQPQAIPQNNHRDNPPIVEIRQNGPEACYYLDDAEDGRPGAVTLLGADFGVQKC